MRGATPTAMLHCQDFPNFNPHSPCGERQLGSYGNWITNCISIHTPHAGSDRYQTNIGGYDCISIHTPHAGSDHQIFKIIIGNKNFNPHSPCGERPYFRELGLVDVNFNPHSPCGERPATAFVFSSRRNFNPHSPCGERPM